MGGWPYEVRITCPFCKAVYDVPQNVEARIYTARYVGRYLPCDCAQCGLHFRNYEAWYQPLPKDRAPLQQEVYVLPDWFFYALALLCAVLLFMAAMSRAGW